MAPTGVDEPPSSPLLLVLLKAAGGRGTRAQPCVTLAGRAPCGWMTSTLALTPQPV